MDIIYQHSRADGAGADWGPGKGSWPNFWEAVEDKLRFHKGKGFTIAERPNPDPGPPRKLAEVDDILHSRVDRSKVGKVFAVRSEATGYTVLVRRQEDQDTKGEQVVARAASRVGVPYVFGVTDCSWLSLVCIADVTGIDLPHNAHAQHLDPRVNAITRAQLKPGDLVFIDDDHHVAIFLDEMYGGRVWDTEPHDTSCPSNWAHDGMLGVGVRIRPMFLPWYCGRINGYGRIPQVNG